jgi:hypothetical protein
MLTLCVRYTFNPEKIADIRAYFEAEQPVIARNGGKTIGCFAPTAFAGPTNQAMWLIDFESLTAYEHYRSVLAADPEHRTNGKRLLASGAAVSMDRSFIERA